ncbi:SPOR domain-containing protein, partial [Lysobacter sp. SG-8]
EPPPAREPEPARTPEPAPVASAPAPRAPAAADVGFAVQIGAFSQAAQAGQLRDKARAAGFSSFIEQVQTDQGTLSRVRVGPVGSRAEAEALKAEVAAKLGVDGMVRPHP